MKRADEAIEKALAGLRAVEVDTGFEKRMVRRVRALARERGAANWFGVRQRVGIGCVAILLLGVGVDLRLREKRDFVAGSIVPSEASRPRPSLERDVEIEEGVSQRVKPRPGGRGYGTDLRGAELLGREAMQRSPRVGDEVKVSRDAGSSEVAGVTAAGFPAPPLPLTTQERLLLRAAQSGDAQPAAVLEVSVLPTHDAEETAEFVEFFGQDRQVEPSTPGENE